MNAGGLIRLTTDDRFRNSGTGVILWVDYKNMPTVVKVGSTVFIDDGLISLTVTETGLWMNSRSYYCTVCYSALRQQCSGKLNEYMIQSSHWFVLLLRLNPVCLGGLRSPASLALSRRPIGSAALAPHCTHPSNSIQTNLASPQRTRSACVVES